MSQSFAKIIIDHCSISKLVKIIKDESCDQEIWQIKVVNYWSPFMFSQGDDDISVDIFETDFLQRIGWIKGWEAYGYDIELTENVKNIIRHYSNLANTFDDLSESAFEISNVNLSKIKLRRELRDFQKENVDRLIKMPRGANFSVPGTGKTSTTLTVYAYLKLTHKVKNMLVICPKSAFESWANENNKTFSAPFSLRTFDESDLWDAEIITINYEKVINPRIREGLIRWMRRNSTMITIDEAHRIKGGDKAVTWKAVKELAEIAVRIDLLTGTPMPQGYEDLRNLFSLSWSPIPPTFFTDSKLQMIERGGVFVRTTKKELGLQNAKLKNIKIPQGDLQREIYSALKNRYQGLFKLSNADRYTLRKKGRAVMTLIAAATNPGLIAGVTDEQSFMGSSDAFLGLNWPPSEVIENESLMAKIKKYRDRERPQKYFFLEKLIQEKAEKGEKIIIWSNFINNMRAIHRRELKDYKCALVYGGVTGIDREKQLEMFRDDNSCVALITNPQTLGEGISLHEVCNNAVYVDRTYNAALYLQSLDRIHRLGMNPNQETNIYFMMSKGTIDELANDSLNGKITRLSQLLDDPNLIESSIAEVDEHADYQLLHGATISDLSAIAEHVSQD